MRWPTICLLSLIITLPAAAQTAGEPESPEVGPAGMTSTATNAAGAETPAKSESEKQPPRISATAALKLRLSAVSFAQTSLKDALDQLGEAAGVTIIALWSQLDDAGIRQDTSIDFAARNIRLEQALWLIMNEPELAGARLAYRADQDTIILATEEFFSRDMVVKVYDIVDLLHTRLRRPSIGVARLHQVPISTVPTVAAGAVGVRPITETYGSGVILEGEDAAGSRRSERQKRIRELIDVITTTIDPDTWAVNGGDGTISVFARKLVIRNSPLVHQKIGKSLAETAP